MIKFDPLGWFEHILPLPWLHRITRLCAIAIVSVFLVVRIGQYQNYFWKPLWAAEALLFIVLAIAFIVRDNPVDRSKGAKEIIVPLIGGVLPFCLLRTPPGAWSIGNTSLLTTLFLWMTLATALTIWGMWVLRYSFSITIEARSLVTRGPLPLGKTSYLSGRNSGFNRGCSMALVLAECRHFSAFSDYSNSACPMGGIKT